MSRFFGILLMLVTGVVLEGLVSASKPEPVNAGLLLAGAFLILGILLGFLATARQFFWSTAGAITVAATQFSSGRVRFPLPAGEETSMLVMLITPPAALILGAWIGARLLNRRYQALIKPEHED